MVDLMLLKKKVYITLMGIFTELDNLEQVFNLIIDDVVADVEECASDEWNDSDVSIAIQRVLMSKLFN
jgi:hypothetical protein